MSRYIAVPVLVALCAAEALAQIQCGQVLQKLERCAGQAMRNPQQCQSQCPSNSMSDACCRCVMGDRPPPPSSQNRQAVGNIMRACQSDCPRLQNMRGPPRFPPGGPRGNSGSNNNNRGSATTNPAFPQIFSSLQKNNNWPPRTNSNPTSNTQQLLTRFSQFNRGTAAGRRKRQTTGQVPWWRRNQNNTLAQTTNWQNQLNRTLTLQNRQNQNVNPPNQPTQTWQSRFNQNNRGIQPIPPPLQSISGQNVGNPMNNGMPDGLFPDIDDSGEMDDDDDDDHGPPEERIARAMQDSSNPTCQQCLQQNNGRSIVSQWTQRKQQMADSLMAKCRTLTQQEALRAMKCMKDMDDDDFMDNIGTGLGQGNNGFNGFGNLQQQIGNIGQSYRNLVRLAPCMPRRRGPPGPPGMFGNFGQGMGMNATGMSRGLINGLNNTTNGQQPSFPWDRTNGQQPSLPWNTTNGQQPWNNNNNNNNNARVLPSQFTNFTRSNQNRLNNLLSRGTNQSNGQLPRWMQQQG